MGLNISPPYGNLTLMQFSIVFKARNIGEAIMDDLFIVNTVKKFPCGKIRRLVEGSFKEWIENIPKEVSIIKDKFELSGKGDIHIEQKSLC